MVSNIMQFMCVNYFTSDSECGTIVLLLSCRYGTWAICFTYGTMFAVRGLVAAGRTYDNSYPIRKACTFLLSKQQSTGGWGESYLSSHNEDYVDSHKPNVVNTSFAMLALIYAGQVERDPVPLFQAARQLINMQLETGEFPQQVTVSL
uniref:Squalene cyclase C-terminal domain-containing protein n=1 Tax=Aegilops tauschii subsp. strangulata TaxID=200361 RepID=A0A453AB26_AEGTS